MNARSGELIDHINHDTLDNRKCNLRVCDKVRNGRNRRLNVNSTSGYKGVTWSEQNRKWMAYIYDHKKFKNLGYYTNVDDAVCARKEAEAKLFGEFAFTIKD